MDRYFWRQARRDWPWLAFFVAFTAVSVGCGVYVVAVSGAMPYSLAVLAVVLAAEAFIWRNLTATLRRSAEFRRGAEKWDREHGL